MNITVINGSPKGNRSITLQTVLYLQKKFKDINFSIINAGAQINALEKAAAGYKLSGPSDNSASKDDNIFIKYWAKYPHFNAFIPYFVGVSGGMNAKNNRIFRHEHLFVLQKYDIL